MQSIVRTTASTEIAARIRSMIVDGSLPEGERINEVHLAAGLGVSRTPVREALNRLAAEGALTNAPSLGYRVRPLDLREFEDFYGIRPILDPAALRLAGLPGKALLGRLAGINRALAEASGAEAAIALDDTFHGELLAACPNRVLIDLIDNLILRTRRYELALMRETGSRSRATAEHGAILDALAAGDLDEACAALKRNLESGREPVVAWLAGRRR